MTLWLPTRRELITTSTAACAVTAASAVPAQILPQPRNLRFLVVGDWGRDGGHYQKHVASFMAKDAYDSGFDFVVSTGDNFYSLGVTSSDDPQWRSSFENIYPAWLRAKPWFPVAGNHDWGGNVFAQIGRKGRDGWRMPWLWYDVPGKPWQRDDVHLFFIDTVVWRAEEDWAYKLCGQALRSVDHERQKTWLKQALAASSAPTKIVFGHHPIYSVGKHGKGMKHMSELDEILVNNRVSAYVCGHDHCLYHITSGAMHYICSGGGSEELRAYSGDKDIRGCVIPGQCGADKARWHTFLDRAGFAVFEVDSQLSRFHFVDRDGRRTLPQIIKPRGTKGTGLPPPNPATVPENATARASSLLPCTSIARIVGI